MPIIERLQEPVAFFLLIMSLILGGMLVGPYGLKLLEAGDLRPKNLEKDAESDLLVVPGFGSRQRFLSSLGRLPEQLAASFRGNLVILHFDR